MTPEQHAFLWEQLLHIALFCAMDFDDLFKRYHWKAIRNCPGRYVLTDVSLHLTVAELLGVPLETHEYSVTAARDKVLVTPLRSGGLISYQRQDGTYVHTLNTPEGWQRKLADLGIQLSGKSARAANT